MSQTWAVDRLPRPPREYRRLLKGDSERSMAIDWAVESGLVTWREVKQITARDLFVFQMEFFKQRSQR